MSFALPFHIDPPRIDVLVVDDNPFMRAAVTRILQRQGRQCVAVASLDAAKMTLLEHPPSLVVTDFELAAGVTGIDLVRWLRCQPTLRAIPCGLMSGANPVHIQDALREGGVGALPLLQKPFGLGELESWVDDLMAPPGNRARNDVS
jgi:CheY-like chemotaxis protein